MKKGRIIFLVVGLAILALLFKTFGIEKTINHIKEMGWRFWLIVLIFLFNHIVLTYTWRVLINFQIKASYFYKLVLARIAGDSTSSLNVLGAIAGEPLKAMFIQDTVPFKTGLASVVMDRTIHTIANLLLIITGIILSLVILKLPAAILLATLAVFGFVLWLMILVLKKQRNGFIEYIIRKLPEKISLRIMTEERWEKVRHLDVEIGNIFKSRKNLRHFYISLFVRYISIFISGTLEIYLIIKFIGIDVSIMKAVFVYIFGLSLTGALFFMPANIGTSEGSYSLALKLLGYDPALGLTVGIIRRLRSFVWSGIGILILFYAGLLKKEVTKE